MLSAPAALAAASRRHPREAGQSRWLELLGSQPETGSVWTTEFMPNAAKLNLVAADDSGSMSVFVFDKNVRGGVLRMLGREGWRRWEKLLVC